MCRQRLRNDKSLICGKYACTTVVVVVVVFPGLVTELQGRDGPLSKTGPRLVDCVCVSDFHFTCKTGF